MAPIRIGEINTYSPSALSGFMATYKRGIELALAEANAAGGALGRPIEMLYRDDKLNPTTAAQCAEALLLEDKVDLIAGTFTSDVGVAVSQAAERLKRVFVATEPRTDVIVWEGGSRYVFRVRTSQSMMVSMMVGHAAKMPQRRWTLVSPSYVGAKRIANIFRERLQALRPDVVFAAPVHYTLGTMSDAVVDEVIATTPEALFTVVYGTDLLPFVRAGNARRLFERVAVANPLAGDPEYLDTLGEEAPEGWLVLGYPGEQDRRPAHLRFAEAYRKQHGNAPDAGALTGYIGMQAIVAGIERAGSLDTEALIRGFRGLEFDSPIGRLLIRRGDHQATHGNWIGKLARRNGRGTMIDWTFLDGADFLPSETEAAALRPAGANA